MIIKAIAANPNNSGENATNATMAIPTSNPIPNTPINIFLGINTNAKIIPININQPIFLSYHLNSKAHKLAN